jgi:CheY-like chemotaxis protein
VIEAANGIEALQRAANEKPGHHPDGPVAAGDGRLGGDAAPEGGRADGVHPVVALTGHALAGISDGAKQAGCDAFVTKPCLPEDLVKEIRKVLDEPAPKKPRRSGKHAKTTG